MTSANSINQIIVYFDSLVRQREDHCCNELFCSTCGGIAGHIKNNIDKEYLDFINETLDLIEPFELYKFRQWEEVIHYLSPEKYELLIKLKKQDIDLNDPQEVNRYLLEARNKLPFDDPSFNATIYQGIKLAVKFQDISLVETLIIILGEKAMDYPQLVDIAINLSRSDCQLQRTLDNKLREVCDDVKVLT